MQNCRSAECTEGPQELSHDYSVWTYHGEEPVNYILLSPENLLQFFGIGRGGLRASSISFGGFGIPQIDANLVSGDLSTVRLW